MKKIATVIVLVLTVTFTHGEETQLQPINVESRLELAKFEVLLSHYKLIETELLAAERQLYTASTDESKAMVETYIEQIRKRLETTREKVRETGMKYNESLAAPK